MSGQHTQPVVVFGGTFDPVHFGHLRTALEIRDLLQVDDFRFLPAGTPPHRSNNVTAAAHRLEMLKRVIVHGSGFNIDPREMDRPGPSFMVDTLREIRSGLSDAPLVLVIGQDSANTLDRWHSWQDIFCLAHLVIMNRPGDRENYPSGLAQVLEGRQVKSRDQLLSAPAGLVMKAEVTGLAISSRHIRGLVRKGNSPRFLLPDAVLEYIVKEQLYN